MRMRESFKYLIFVSVAAIAFVGRAGIASGEDSGSILKQHQNINVISSTVPTNGDINPLRHRGSEA